LYYSLIVGGAIPAGVVLGIMVIVWFRTPVFALYAALFVLLLPIGVIPPEIHSIFNRTLTIAAFVFWFFAAVTHRSRMILTNTMLLMLAFLIWGSITLFWADNLESGAAVLQKNILRLLVFLLMIPSLVRSREELNGLMKTIAINGWVLMIIACGIIFYTGYNPGTRFGTSDMGANGWGMLAVVTLLGVFWGTMQSSKQNRKPKRLMAAIFLTMTIALTALSGSRGSAISLFVTLLALCFWKQTRYWGKLGLFIIVGAAIITPFVFTLTVDRFAGRTGETFLGGREDLWQTGWQIVQEHPLRGLGLGNSSFKVEKITGADWELETKSVGTPIHNPVLVIWSETGILGVILYLGVLISAVLSFVQQYLQSRSLGIWWMTEYFALIGSVFLGYIATWIKGGGAESDFLYFLMLALLLVPSALDLKKLSSLDNIETEKIVWRMSGGNGGFGVKTRI
jgi:O-antigen ligase